MSKKDKKILFWLPLVLFIFNNTIVSLLVVSFYIVVFVIWLFKMMPKD